MQGFRTGKPSVGHSMAFTLNHPLSADSHWLGGGGATSKASLCPRRSFLLTSLRISTRRSPLLIGRAKARGADADQQSKKSKDSVQSTVEEEEEVEEELPWIQEKALDLVEFTGTVTQAIPGPRVGQSTLPWILAVPLAYVGLSFVFAFYKTVKKFTSPRAKRKKLVNKNAFLLKSIDELFEKGWEQVNQSALKGLMQKIPLLRMFMHNPFWLITGFKMDDILRKYIRYVLNEKHFNADAVASLIHLRKASMLEDLQVAEVLNETSRRIVKEKGPVVMDISGFTEKGFKRKLAVQALFGKVFYLSEIPEFCSKDNSLVIKEIFGVTDEDADTLRLHTLSESGDVETLEKLVDDADSDEPDDESVSVS